MKLFWNLLELSALCSEPIQLIIYFIPPWTVWWWRKSKHVYLHHQSDIMILNPCQKIHESVTETTVVFVRLCFCSFLSSSNLNPSSCNAFFSAFNFPLFILVNTGSVVAVIFSRCSWMSFVLLRDSNSHLR